MAHIVLAVTGSIAAFKAADLCSKLHQSGHDVHVVMTEAATKLVAVNTFLYLSGHRVHVDMFDPSQAGVIEHISLADEADLIVIAPATANTLASLAQGRADNMVTTLALAADSPVLVCPAMNPRMWAHPAVRRNLETIERDGLRVLSPESGSMACGHIGPGRLVEPPTILAVIEAMLGPEGWPVTLQKFEERLVLKPGAALESSLLEAEASYRKSLKLKGQVLFRAAFEDAGWSQGGLLLLQARDRAGAEALSAGSPFVKAGIFEVTIRPCYES